MGLFVKKKKNSGDGDGSCSSTGNSNPQDAAHVLARQQPKRGGNGGGAGGTTSLFGRTAGSFRKSRSGASPRTPRKLSLSPRRKSSPKVTTPNTEESASPKRSSFLESLNIHEEENSDNGVEVLTKESQAFLARQIRKALFAKKRHHTPVFRRVATARSQEVTREGDILDAESWDEGGGMARHGSAPPTSCVQLDSSGRAVEENFDASYLNSSCEEEEEEDGAEQPSFEVDYDSTSPERTKFAWESSPERPDESSKPPLMDSKDNKQSFTDSFVQPMKDHPTPVEPSKDSNRDQYIVEEKKEELLEEQTTEVRNKEESPIQARKEESKEDSFEDEAKFRDGIEAAQKVMDNGILSSSDDYDFSTVTSATRTTAPVRPPPQQLPEPKPVSLVDHPTAKKLLKAFRCDDDTTLKEIAKPLRVMDLFYDKVCQPLMSDEKRKPYYNEEFTLEFLHVMMTDGVHVLHLQPPGSPNNHSTDWNGRTVNMVIEPGTTGDDYDVQPKLEWTTIAGGQTYDVSK